jgi:hypothetical protein
MSGLTGVSQTTSASLSSLGLGDESSARSSSPENRRAGDNAPVTIAPNDERIYVSSNELGRDTTLKVIKAFPNRGNAIYGCSGTFVLDLASLRDGIEHVAVFDISPKVEQFWEGASKMIASLDPTNLEESQQKFLAFVGKINEFQKHLLQSNIKEGHSFLSSSDRLARICKIFQARHFTFTRLDLGNPVQFKAFLDEQTQRGAKPHAVYISNIVHMTTGALMHGSNILNRHKRYKDFDRSLSLIPAEAILIDAVKKDPGDRYSTQRVHLKARVDILPPLCNCAFKTALESDDYDDVRYAIAHGADPKAVDTSGYTHLLTMGEKGKVNSIRALLDCGVDVDSTGQGDESRNTALHCAANADQADAVELLVARKANIDAAGDQNMTPLHFASSNGSLKATRVLVELGANRSRKDAKGFTPLDLTKARGAPVFKKAGTPAYRELQELLKKGCPRREAKESKGAGPSPSVNAGPGNASQTLKSDADKADGKS